MIRDQIQEKIIASYTNAFDVKEKNTDGTVPSPASLSEAIAQKLIDAIREEIFSDPMAMGYEGKSLREIVSILNKPIIKTKRQSYREGESVLDRLFLSLLQRPRIPDGSVQSDENGSVSVSLGFFSAMFSSAIETELRSGRYEGMSIADAIRRMATREVVVEEETEVLPSRYFSITQGMPFVPNEATEEMVAMAMRQKGEDYAKRDST